MMTKRFWVAVAERAVKTFAQALAAVLGAAQVGVLDADWVGALSTAVMAAVLSALSSVASAELGAPGPSLAGERLQ